jgi:hypothetical protein
MQTDFLYILRQRPKTANYCCSGLYCGKHDLWLTHQELTSLQSHFCIGFKKPHMILSPECVIDPTKVTIVETGPDYVVVKCID